MRKKTAKIATAKYFRRKIYFYMRISKNVEYYSYICIYFYIYSAFFKCLKIYLESYAYFEMTKIDLSANSNMRERS